MRLVGWSAGFLGVLALAVLALFLGGLLSAVLEVRAEKRAGKVPTRPAWDNRDKRRAIGGFREQWKGAVESARSRLGGGFVGCWCLQGPVAEFPAGGGFEAGLACVAWEAGADEALRRHDAAGGYKRTPVAS